MPRQRIKPIGWWEDYPCGCVSPVVPLKRDLLGYCDTHGGDRRHVWPELPTGHPIIKNDDDPAEQIIQNETRAIEILSQSLRTGGMIRPRKEKDIYMAGSGAPDGKGAERIARIMSIVIAVAPKTRAGAPQRQMTTRVRTARWWHTGTTTRTG